MKARATILLLVILASFGAVPSYATNGPLVTVQSPTNNSVVSENIEIIQRSSTARFDADPVYEWCFRIEGPSNLSLAGLEVFYSSYNSADSIYWSDSKLIIDSHGCIATTIGYNIGKTWLQLDLRSWANGTYRISTKVTNQSGITSPESQVSFSINHPLPSIVKTIGQEDLSQAAGILEYTFAATASQSGGAEYVRKWCLEIDGRGVGVNDTFDAANFPGTSNPLESTNISSEPGCYVNTRGVSGSITQGSLRFDSGTWNYGTHTITVKVFNSAGYSSTVSYSVVKSQTAQELEWVYPDNSPYTGQKYEVYGMLSEPIGSSFPARVRIRTWQVKSGWTKWSYVNVDESGHFWKTYSVTSNLKVQVNIPSHGSIPNATYSDLIRVNGHLRVSVQESAHWYQTVRFKVTMSPRWSGYVYCQKIVTKNSWDYFTHPKIYLRNGVGYFSTTAGTDRITRIGLSCSSRNSQLGNTSDAAGVDIY
jgi:hypothetical protein